MIGAILGSLIAVIVNIAVVAYGYGKLVETVKAQPKMMRLAMKLEVKEALEQHVSQYYHEEREFTSPGRRPPHAEAMP